MKNCPNCGALNNNEASFCLQCGANLIQANNMINNNIVQPNNINSFNSNNIELNTQDLGVSNNPETPKGSNKNLIIIATIIGIIAAIVIGILLFKGINKDSVKNKNQNNETSNNEKIKNPSVFFLHNSDKYALFDENGDNLSGFIYSPESEYEFTKTEFVLVKDTSSETYKIIDSKGKEIFEFKKGTYVRLFDELIFNSNKKGDKGDLYTLSGKKVMSDINELYSVNGSSSTIREWVSVYVDEENNYIILNNKGEQVYTIPVPEGIDCNIHQKDNVLQIYYYSGNEKYFYFYSYPEEKMIYEMILPFGYEVENYSEGYKKILFTYLDSYILYDDGVKVLEGNVHHSNGCDPVLVKGKLMCTGFKNNYFFNEKGELDLSLNISDYEILDENNYAIVNKETDAVEIYNNNILVNSYPNYDIDHGDLGYYHLTCYGCGTYNTAMIVNKEGQSVSSPNGDYVKFFRSGYMAASEFFADANSIIGISHRGKVFDINGDEVNLNLKDDEYFSTIDYYSEDRIAGRLQKDDSSDDVIMDNKGNILLKGHFLTYLDPLKYPNIKWDIAYDSYSDDDGKSKYAVYNVTTNKIIATLDKYPEFYENYFIVYDGDIYYYSYSTGKLFHTLET